MLEDPSRCPRLLYKMQNFFFSFFAEKMLNIPMKNQLHVFLAFLTSCWPRELFVVFGGFFNPAFLAVRGA